MTPKASPISLQERLSIRNPAGNLSVDVRRNRESLCDFIRSIEDQVFTADGKNRTAIREILGWDDEAFQLFITSPLITQSSPHACMNAFSPMLVFPWVQRSIQRLASLLGPGRPVHLRTLVMHNNLGDLRWRPYAWWHRGPDGSIRKTTLFGRSHSTRRRVLLALPSPNIDLSICGASDKPAVLLASRASNYAYFCAIYRGYIERLAGFHLPHMTIEVPLNILNAFTFTRESLLMWFDLASELRHESIANSIRKINESGELAWLRREEAAIYAAGIRQINRFPIVCTNTQNFAQVYQFGITCMIGAEKMARYVASMNEEVRQLYSRIDWHYELPEFIPITRIPAELVAPIDELSCRALQKYGFNTSLPICVADYGDLLAVRLDTLLTSDYRDFFPEHETMC